MPSHSDSFVSAPDEGVNSARSPSKGRGAWRNIRRDGSVPRYGRDGTADEVCCGTSLSRGLTNMDVTSGVGQQRPTD